MAGTVGRRKQGRNKHCFHPDRRRQDRARPENRYDRFIRPSGVAPDLSASALYAHASPSSGLSNGTQQRLSLDCALAGDKLPRSGLVRSGITAQPSRPGPSLTRTANGQPEARWQSTDLILQPDDPELFVRRQPGRNSEPCSSRTREPGSVMTIRSERIEFASAHNQNDRSAGKYGAMPNGILDGGSRNPEMRFARQPRATQIGNDGRRMTLSND